MEKQEEEKGREEKMASDDSMTVVSSMREDEYEDIDVGFDHDHDHQVHPHNLSRLSTCTSSMYEDDEDDDDDDDDPMRMYLSRLLIESIDADVDEYHFSGKELLELSSDDSDKEPSCYSLPTTPPHQMDGTGVLSRQLMGVGKDYASENEARKRSFGRPKGSKILRKRRKERQADKESTKSSSKKKDGDFMVRYSNYSGSFSGESEGGSGAGVVVITRPKGGRRSLCMDLEEVKACRDLGFELEHELMLEMPSASRVSLSCSTLDTTSSGGNSPIANWRISSPGDDPRDVKARLKVWAQAVALASSSRHCS